MIKDIVGINRQFYDWIREGPWTITSNLINFNITREGDTVYIKFQESSDPNTKKGWHDWLRNLDFIFKYDPYLKVLVHRGFLNGWLKCNYEIISVMYHSLTTPIKEIVFCGFSQGADLSLICATYFKKFFEDDNSVKVSCYAFAPSQIWWCFLAWRLRKYFKKDMHLIINYGDPASKLPSKWWGYKHLGTQHLIGNSKAKTNVRNHWPENFRLNLPEVSINNNEN
jgi:hypothetical protein